MSSTYHLLLMAMFCFSCPMWHLKFQICMAVQWMVWTKCATVTLGAPLKPQKSKIILGYTSGGLLVHVISNILMITCIAMGVSGITPNGLVLILSHLLWIMFPLLGPLLSVRYGISHLCALLCVILEYYTSTPYLLECRRLAFILVYMIIMWPMAHAVNHWT